MTRQYRAELRKVSSQIRMLQAEVRKIAKSSARSIAKIEQDRNRKMADAERECRAERKRTMRQTDKLAHGIMVTISALSKRRLVLEGRLSQ